VFHPPGKHGTIAETDFFPLSIGFEITAADARGVQADPSLFFGKPFTGDAIAFRGFFGAAGI
jgi:hypothetical protein